MVVMISIVALTLPCYDLSISAFKRKDVVSGTELCKAEEQETFACKTKGFSKNHVHNSKCKHWKTCTNRTSGGIWPAPAPHLRLSCGTCCSVCWRSVRRRGRVWWSESWPCESEPAFCRCSETWIRGSRTSFVEPLETRACSKVTKVYFSQNRHETESSQELNSNITLAHLHNLWGAFRLSLLLLTTQGTYFCLKQQLWVMFELVIASTMRQCYCKGGKTITQSQCMLERLELVR